MTIRFEYRAPTVSEYKKLRDCVGWWEVDDNNTEIALSHSLYSVVVMEDHEVVGLGRIVGDGGLYFYIQDLMVHPEFRNRGLGKKVMDDLMSYIRAIAKPGAFVGLMTARGLVKYYESFGFRTRDPDAPGMYRIID